jgi:hypothetical protein
VEVLRPQSCKEMHATAWRASLHLISTSYAKKRRKFQRLPFLGTRQVHPHSQLKISQWGGVCSGSAAPPILQRNACNCLASIIASHFNFICKEKTKVSTPAVFGHPPSAPHSQLKISQWGGVCSGSAAPPILQRNACNCLASIIASHFNFICKEKTKVSTPAVFGHPPSAPHSQLKISQWGWVCSRGGARRLRRFGVYRLHCEHALIMFDLYS